MADNPSIEVKSDRTIPLGIGLVGLSIALSDAEVWPTDRIRILDYPDDCVMALYRLDKAISMPTVHRVFQDGQCRLIRPSVWDRFFKAV